MTCQSPDVGPDVGIKIVGYGVDPMLLMFLEQHHELSLILLVFHPSSLLGVEMGPETTDLGYIGSPESWHFRLTCPSGRRKH
jgi:hypothetical protein